MQQQNINRIGQLNSSLFFKTETSILCTHSLKFLASCIFVIIYRLKSVGAQQRKAKAEPTDDRDDLENNRTYNGYVRNGMWPPLRKCRLEDLGKGEELMELANAVVKDHSKQNDIGNFLCKAPKVAHSEPLLSTAL